MDNNYYQEIIGKINHFITNQKWDAALKLVEQELAVAYIPMIYETQFQKLQQEIVANVKQLSEPEQQRWSLEKIVATITDLGASESHLVAFYYLQQHNVRLILPIIIEYLHDKKINNFNKTQLLYILQAQGINQNFQVIKSHGTFQVNPISLVLFKATSAYQAIEKIFQKTIAIENPGIYQICLYLLDSYFESLVPVVPNIKHKSAIVAAIYIRACSLQFIKVTLVSSAKKFHSTTRLIKTYLLDMQNHKIN